MSIKNSNLLLVLLLSTISIYGCATQAEKKGQKIDEYISWYESRPIEERAKIFAQRHRAMLEWHRKNDDMEIGKYQKKLSNGFSEEVKSKQVKSSDSYNCIDKNGKRSFRSSPFGTNCVVKENFRTEYFVERVPLSNEDRQGIINKIKKITRLSVDEVPKVVEYLYVSGKFFDNIESESNIVRDILNEGKVHLAAISFDVTVFCINLRNGKADGETKVSEHYEEMLNECRSIK